MQNLVKSVSLLGIRLYFLTKSDSCRHPILTLNLNLDFFIIKNENKKNKRKNEEKKKQELKKNKNHKKR